MRNGDMAAAASALQEAAQVVTPVICTATPVLDNSSTKKTWNAKVTDPDALIKAIAAGTVPLSVVKEFNITLLKDEAKRRGGLDWPGVQVWQEESLSVRR